MGARRKARECALQILFAADVAKTPTENLTRDYWNQLGETDVDDETREFADKLAKGTLRDLEKVDAQIRARAEHWRIPRMAIVDRNVLRLAVYEFLLNETPHTVIINEALEIARRFSTFEATQFINGILDAVKNDLENKNPAENSEELEKTKTSSR